MPGLREADLKGWLHGEGNYRYACFISWASRSGRHAEQAAHKLESKLYELLRLEGWCDGSVYLAKAQNEPGEDWYAAMTRALCDSVVLVAICAPEYYESEHCRREWAGMETLEANGCAARVIPVILRDHVLPPPVKSRHIIERLKDTNFIRDWTERGRFSKVVDDIARVTKQRAADLYRLDLKAQQIPLPHRSSLDDYRAGPPPYPSATGSL